MSLSSIAPEESNLSASLPQLSSSAGNISDKSKRSKHGDRTLKHKTGVFRSRATLNRRKSMELLETTKIAEYSKQSLPSFSPKHLRKAKSLSKKYSNSDKKEQYKHNVGTGSNNMKNTMKTLDNTTPSSTSSTPRSIISKSKYFHNKLQALTLDRYIHSNNFTKNQHSVLVDERNRLCKDILEKAEGNHLRGHGKGEISTEEQHTWKQQGYLYERNMMQVEATLEWLLKMKDGSATEADKPIFVTDVKELLISGDKETKKTGGKSRLVQGKKPSFHIKDQFWSNSSKQRVLNKLNYYRDLERRRILDKNIKDYETAELADIAKKFGEDANVLINKLKWHKENVFNMTKQYWRDRLAQNSEKAAKLASTAKILREEALRKKQEWKTRTITKRKEKARKKKRKEDLESAQRGWLRDLSVLHMVNIFRRLILNGRASVLQMKRESEAQTCISRHWRIHHAQKQNDKKRNASIVLQRVTRGWQSRLFLIHRHNCADIIYNHLKSVGKLRVLKKGLEMRHNAARRIQRAWKDRKLTLTKELNNIEKVFTEIGDNEGLDVEKIIAKEIRAEILNEILRKKRIIFKDTTLAKYSFDFKNYNKKIARLKEQSKEDPSAKALIYMVKKPRRPSFRPKIADSEMRQALSLCMELKKKPKRWRARQARTKRWLKHQYSK